MARYEIKGGVGIIPEGTTAIDDKAFKGRIGLFSVVIPDTVEVIGDYAFEGCRSLISVVIPKAVKEIGSCAFQGCRILTSVVIPESVKEIGSCAFRGCWSLTEIVIPGKVKKISKDVFNDCKRLTRIYVPANQIKHYKSLLPKHLHNKLKSIACMELYKTEGILKKMQLIKNKPQIFFAWLNANKMRSILFLILFGRLYKKSVHDGMQFKENV